MKFSRIGLVIAAIGFATSAFAWPASPLMPHLGVTQVQLQCSPASCIDPRTGVYTQSTCDRYGCRPISGPVGRVGGQGPAYRGGGYDDGYERMPRRRDWDDSYNRGGGGFDCNASRCIDGSGRVWESTCDRRVCRPLRPARGYR